MKRFVPLARMTYAHFDRFVPDRVGDLVRKHDMPADEVVVTLREELLDDRVSGVDLATGRLVYLPTLEKALLAAFGGGEVKTVGLVGRGGHTEIRFAGAAPASVRELTKKIKAAMKAAGYSDQQMGAFPTRELSHDGAPEYYVERGVNRRQCVISPAGTAARPFLTINA